MLPVLYLGQDIFAPMQFLDFRVHRDEEKGRVDVQHARVVVVVVVVVGAIPVHAVVAPVLDNAFLLLALVVCAVFLFLEIDGILLHDAYARALV